MLKLKNENVNSLKLSNLKNYCRAERETVVFSFAYITEDKTFGLNGFKDVKQLASLYRALKLMSQQTWSELINRGKDKGLETILITELKPSIQNVLSNKCDQGEKIYISRFNGAKCRILYRRGSKCSRVAQILAIEWTLGDAYKHN